MSFADECNRTAEPEFLAALCGVGDAVHGRDGYLVFWYVSSSQKTILY